MKRLEITINGEAYPCSPTMGAMLRFKQEIGREITEINASSFTDLCTYLWCCVMSASKREGKPFGLTLMDFADAITPEDMAEWNNAITSEEVDDVEEEEDSEAEKKSL